MPGALIERGGHPINAKHDRLVRTILVLALVLLIPSAETVTAYPNLLAYPYLDETTLASVVISWATDKSGVSEVRYSLDSSYSSLVAATNNVYDGKYWHSATIAGLAAGTTYRYKVYTSGHDITPWPEITFTTASEPAASLLLAYPYLGETTHTSVVISWATDQPGANHIRYSLDASYNRLVAATNSTYDGKYWHSATIAGLAAGTTYKYKVYTGGHDITPWPDITFTTASEPTASLLTFVVLGDSRPSDASSPPSQGALDVAAQIDRQSFELALHTGDMVDNGGICSGSNSSWNQYLQAYFGLYRQSIGHTPFYPSLGNHEMDGGSCGYTSYTNVYNLPKNAPSGNQEEYYSFDWGNAHFVALDTYQDYSVGSTQYNWLVNDLRASTQPWQMVFFHTPAYSSGEHGSTIELQTQLVPVLETYGVDVVFSGHDHDYERTCPILNGACTTPQAGGVTYYVTGGGGAGLRPVSRNWFTAYSDSVYHFIKAQIDGCRLRLDAIDAHGHVFDSYEIDHCPQRSRQPATTQSAVRSTFTLLDLNRRQQ